VSGSIAPRPERDYNLRILWPLSRWVDENLGREALDAVLEPSGVTREHLEAREWVSAETFEGILARARARMADDETFMRASAHRLGEAYGPIRYVLWAASPGAVFTQMVKNYHLVSTVGRLSIISQKRTRVHVRVEPEGRTISRLNCLVRQANLRAMPTLWGLPAAHIQETSCIGLGDRRCELHMRWYAARSLLPIALGAALFWLLSVALARTTSAAAALPWCFGLLGAALGYVADVRRTERINRIARQEVTEALRSLASNEAEARREMVDLNHRQKEWTRLLEGQVGERSSALERVVEGMQDLQQERVNKMLGFSHDLRNPLQVVQLGAEVLQRRCQGDPYLAGVVTDMDEALAQMRKMLAELVKTATDQQRTTAQFEPQRIEVADLRERLQRRLRALVFGRDVRATVLGTDDAPQVIEMDPLLLDRIVDNLLTNAAKYTERGTIVVELDGAPGFLVLKVTDTGCGIDPREMDQIFTPGGSSPDSRRGDSFGVGLSVVVQLLDQLGGRLEVMSKPREGTTFWVHFPLKAGSGGPLSGSISRAGKSESVSRVVHVRRMTA
jgi:signal transduction histidine kinase